MLYSLFTWSNKQNSAKKSISIEHYDTFDEAFEGLTSWTCDEIGEFNYELNKNIDENDIEVVKKYVKKGGAIWTWYYERKGVGNYYKIYEVEKRLF